MVEASFWEGRPSCIRFFLYFSCLTYCLNFIDSVGSIARVVLLGPNPFLKIPLAAKGGIRGLGDGLENLGNQFFFYLLCI